MLELLFALRILFLLLLYGFLALIIYYVRRDLQARSQPGATPQTAVVGDVNGPRLTVVASGETGLPEGRHFQLRSITTIGRELANDIVISDGFASGRHARVERREARYWVEDLGSRNGTLLNDARLAPYDPAPLDPGDVITIGQTRLKFG